MTTVAYEPPSVEARRLTHQVATVDILAPLVNRDRLIRLMKARDADTIFDTVVGNSILEILDTVHGGHSVYFHDQIIAFLVTYFIASDVLIDNPYTHPNQELLNIGKAIVRQAEQFG